MLLPRRMMPLSSAPHMLSGGLPKLSLSIGLSQYTSMSATTLSVTWHGHEYPQSYPEYLFEKRLSRRKAFHSSHIHVLSRPESAAPSSLVEGSWSLCCPRAGEGKEDGYLRVPRRWRHSVLK